MALLLAALLLGTLGTKIPTNHDIETRLEQAIRDALHPAAVMVTVERASIFSTTFQRVDISIDGFNADSLPLSLVEVPGADSATIDGDDPTGAPIAEPKRTAKQVRLRQATLRCTNFTINKLRVEQLDINAEDLYLPLQAVSAGQFEIAGARAVTGMVSLRQQDLTAYLRTRDLPITDPTVKLSPAECRVSGKSRTLIHIPIELSGVLTARDGAVLYLDNPRLRVSIVPVPGFIADRVLKDINPLGDLNAEFKLPAPLNITKTTLRDGTLVFEGTLNFPPPEP